MSERKVAVVTGGSRGIGRAICLALAAQNCDIALIYAGNEDAANKTVSECVSLGARAVSYKCDVSDYEETEKTFKQIKADFSTFDILVNNAGITCDKLMLSMKSEEFNRVIGVNLTGCFNATKQVYGVMAKKRSGRIINISSVAGIMGNAGQTNYAASKAGVIGLTKSVAKELAPRGVCCNAICPGFVSTDMTSEFENNEAAKAAIPLGRFGKPEEIAALCAFLCSDGGAYITGQTITVDGGMCM
ncbi:MAG: 3-oxoacyl-[acyl-carrier-protein] reductase [Clostridiales bacterium]|nr:MAG: 3-oxoacyl-[acyl-carrier-protein] reductase [Clostridiales bacterium]